MDCSNIHGDHGPEELIEQALNLSIEAWKIKRNDENYLAPYPLCMADNFLIAESIECCSRCPLFAYESAVHGVESGCCEQSAWQNTVLSRKTPAWRESVDVLLNRMEESRKYIKIAAEIKS
jgi:hypothetical protein